MSINQIVRAVYEVSVVCGSFGIRNIMMKWNLSGVRDLRGQVTRLVTMETLDKAATNKHRRI